jgi:hypothetical protein
MTDGKPARQRKRQAEQTGKDGRRSTLGFLLADIHIGTGRSLWPAIVKAARRSGVNLV